MLDGSFSYCTVVGAFKRAKNKSIFSAKRLKKGQPKMYQFNIEKMIIQGFANYTSDDVEYIKMHKSFEYWVFTINKSTLYILKKQ